MATALRPAADDRLLGKDGPFALLGKVPGAVHRRAHKVFLSGRELDRLGSSPHPAGPKLARAIRASIDKSVAAPEERAWADRIEALRRELLASTDELEVVDYGAVEPGMEVSSDDMYAGRPLRRRVGEICRSASKPPQWAFLLLELVRAFGEPGQRAHPTGVRWPLGGESTLHKREPRLAVGVLVGPDRVIAGPRPECNQEIQQRDKGR